jgi:hypothetical protein
LGPPSICIYNLVTGKDIPWSDDVSEKFYEPGKFRKEVDSFRDDLMRQPENQDVNRLIADLLRNPPPDRSTLLRQVEALF